MAFATTVAKLNQSFSVLKALTEGMISVRDQAKFGELKLQLLQTQIDITQQLFDLQQEQARLLDRAREAEDDLSCLPRYY